MILRAEMYVSLERIASNVEPISEELYQFMLSETLSTARHLVNWCYDQGYLDRDECFNIKHWLYWYDDPFRLEPECCFFEDFRYE